MTRQELRVFFQKWFCGCGQPEDAAAALLRLLRLHPLHRAEARREFEAWIPDEGVQYLLLYQLDHLDLTEHGGTVSGGWLSAEGDRVLEALVREEADGFKAACAACCIHGYAIGIDPDDPVEPHTCR